MIVDSSAIVAVLGREPGHEALIAQIDAAPSTAVGAPTLVETGQVLVGRLGPAGRTYLAGFLADLVVVILPFGDDHWPVALDAFARFGKGRHPAALNFGDCLTYAVARLAGEPLLCVGDDFPQTDLALAWAR